MTEYEIRTKRDDMPPDYVGRVHKWAHDDKAAVLLLLKKRPDANGRCVFKRGGTGRIISVTEVKDNNE